MPILVCCLPLNGRFGSTWCSALQSVSSAHLVLMYDLSSSICAKRASISGVQNWTEFMSRNRARLMRRPPDSVMPRQFLKLSETRV